jgi:arsenate reductase (thioredoxin)
MPERWRIVFVCTGNACRSQMAEGWARRLLPEKIEPMSAGVLPTRLDPRAVRVMAELGIDISSQRSKHLEELAGSSIDWVVTVCDAANAMCPILPADIRRIHVGFDDPPSLSLKARSEEDALKHYRRVRDELREFVMGLPRLLGESIPADSREPGA